MTALGQGAEPGPLGRGPGAEAGGARPVRRLVTRLVQARQRAVRRPGQQGAPAQEPLRLVQRGERAVRGQPALERPALAKLGERFHRPMMTPTRSSAFVSKAYGLSLRGCAPT